MVQKLTESRFGIPKFGIPIEIRSLMSAVHGLLVMEGTHNYRLWREITNLLVYSYWLWREPLLLKRRESLLLNYNVPRESVLFIGTQFSILYTSMYSPAEAAIFGNSGLRGLPTRVTLFL